MDLRGTPFRIDFAGNAPEFVVYAPPYTVSGRKYSHTFSLTTLPAGYIVLVTPYFTIRWNIIDGTSNHLDVMSTATTPARVYAQLADKLQYNYTVSQYYDISLAQDSTKCYITLVDKACARYDTLITLSVSSQSERFSATTESVTNGINAVPIRDYRIMAKMMVRKGTSATAVTPELMFTPSGDKVTISTEIVRPYFDHYDRPAYNETFGVYECPEVVRFIKLLFAEKQNETVGYVKQSAEIMLINGHLEDYAFRNNMPDWTALNHDKFYRKSGIDIFGQDNAATVKTHYDTEQYLYISNFTNNSVSLCQLTVTVNKNGTVTTSTQLIGFTAKAVHRLPVSLIALGISDPETVTTYSVSIAVGDASISRTYIVTPKPYYGHTLLLLNKMNLYETFTIDNLSKEKKTEGEKVMLRVAEMYNTTDTETVYTARTGWKTASETALLEAAVQGKENMLLEGQYGLKFSVIPDTFTILDESEDLLSAELQFIVTDKINRTPIYLTTVNSDVTLTETIIR